MLERRSIAAIVAALVVGACGRTGTPNVDAFLAGTGAGGGASAGSGGSTTTGSAAGGATTVASSSSAGGAAGASSSSSSGGGGAPIVLPLGPDELECGCTDGAEVSVCTTIDCTSDSAQTAACTVLCADHEGLAFAGCVPDQATLCPQGDGGPLVLPYGSDYLVCNCRDGLEFDACTTSCPTTGLGLDDVCGPYCLQHQGIQTAECSTLAFDRCPPADGGAG